MKIQRRTDLEIDESLSVAGEQGEQGPQGIQGERGRDSTIPGPMGPPGESAKSFNPRGEYRSNRVYSPLDVVTDAGSSFLCTQETKSSPPGKAWQLLAAKGEPGEDGVSIQGPKGRPGQTTISQPKIPAVFDSATSSGGVVRVSGSGRVDLAIANATDADALAVGLAVESVRAGETGHYVNSGTVSNPDWNWTPGAALYLSPSVAGGMTETFPNEIGNRVVICGTALSPTEIAVGIHWALVIGS